MTGVAAPTLSTIDGQATAESMWASIQAGGDNGADNSFF